MACTDAGETNVPSLGTNAVTIDTSSNLLDWEAIFTNAPIVGPLSFYGTQPRTDGQWFYLASEAH